MSERGSLFSQVHTHFKFILSSQKSVEFPRILRIIKTKIVEKNCWNSIEQNIGTWTHIYIIRGDILVCENPGKVKLGAA